MKIKESGQIDNSDIDILEFVSEMGVVTKEQIKRFCIKKGIENGEDRLAPLCNACCLNSFVLTTEAKYKGKFPPDIMRYYVLHAGGAYLLERFKGIDMLNWTQANNVMCSRLVGKSILNTELYLEMITQNKPLIYYDKAPIYDFAHNVALRGGAVYGFRAGDGSVFYLLTEIIRSSEKTKTIRQRVRNYETLVGTKYWRRYYNDSKEAPVLLFLTDNDDVAFSLAREIRDSTKLSTFMMSTDERILKGISNEGSIFIYDRETDTMNESKIEI